MALLLVSCSDNKEEPTIQPTATPVVEPQPEVAEVPIDFDVQVADHAVTRSGDAKPARYGDNLDSSDATNWGLKTGFTDASELYSNENVPGKGFGVFGIFTGNSNFGTGDNTPTDNIERQLIMLNQNIYHKVGGPKWTYSNPRYWPANAAKISFFAYAPYQTTYNYPQAGDIDTDPTDGYKYLKSVRFQVPSISYSWSNSDPLDLMWGTAKEDTYDINGTLIKKKGEDFTDMRRPADKTLHWNFKHALARTRFYIANYMSTAKMLSQADAIGLKNTKTAYYGADGTYSTAEGDKPYKGWYISFSGETGGTYNIWHKFKEVDMRLVITSVELSGFYDNGVLQLVNDEYNATWTPGTKHSESYELKPKNPAIYADISGLTIDDDHIITPDGGLAGLQSLKFEDDADLYNISENQSGKKYESLSDALNDVPPSEQGWIKRITYIDKASNEYVQYKLTAPSWSSIDGDWALYKEEIPLNVALKYEGGNWVVDDSKTHYLMLIPQKFDSNVLGNNIKVTVKYQIFTHVVLEDSFTWNGENDTFTYNPTLPTTILPYDHWIASDKDPQMMYGYLTKDLQSNKSYKIVIKLGKVMSLLFEVTDWDDSYEIEIPAFE